MTQIKRRLMPVLATIAVSTAAIAQEITPVWVQHINGLIEVTPDDKLPILVKAGGSGDATYGFNGRDVIDSYVSFVKYNDDLYLLGVRENGINEDDPNLTQEIRDRAAAYPDRSVIWIDALSGRSLGLALKTEVLPVPLAAPEQSPTHAWWKFGIQDGPHGERAIYTGYKYKVLRYAPAEIVQDPNFPDGRATWSATPTEAWIEPVPGEPSGDGSSGGDGSASWRLKAFRVWGSGNDTKLWIGGGTWRSSMQPQELSTTNGGLTFQPSARMNDRGDNTGEKGQYSQGGQPSRFVAYPPDPSRPGLKVSYMPHYPGAGWETRLTRHTRNPNGDGVLPRNGGTGRPNFYEFDSTGTNDFPAFNWEAAGKDGIPIDHKVDGVARYDGNWVMACDTEEGLDYIVTYSIPSWNQVFGGVGADWPNSVDPNSTFKPGWIGIHTLDGKIAAGQSAFKLEVYETDEPILDPNGNGGTGHDYGYDGDIIVFKDREAPANSGHSLALWAGGSYGFGVFRIENVPAEITQDLPATLNLEEGQPLELAIEATGSPIKYQWYKDDVALTTNATASSYTLERLALTDAGTYKVKVLNPLGDLESNTTTLTVVSDTTPPAIASVSARMTQTRVCYVIVKFSERVTAASAGTAANYQLSGGLTISGATVEDAWTVALATSVHTPGTEYTVTVNNVRDQAAGAGNVIAANSQATFKAWSLMPGLVAWEFFPGIPVISSPPKTTDLPTSPNWPNYPAEVRHFTSFDTIAALGGNFAETFGGKLSGWITPTESGSYRFFIRSDDASDLLISPDDDPAKADVIAQETGCCGAFEEPSVTVTETSEPIALTAGQKYYLSAEYIEGVGGDYVQVAWRKEGDATPAANLTPIPGAFFEAYAPAEPPKFNQPTISGGVVTFTWTGTGTLEESSNLSDWSAVAGNPASGYQVTPAAGESKSYRLRQ
jgi:hypothetical protein